MRYRSTSTSSISHEDRIRRPSKEDHDEPSRSRSEEERDRLRREWLRVQKLKREHEKLKREKIIEYEMKRARILQLKEQTSRRRRSNSRSRSAERHSSESQGTSAPVFNGPEGLKISLADLHKVQVTINNIDVPASATSTEIVRDLIDPTDVIVKRRYGEGSKPIFERAELLQPFKGDETEGQRRIITVDSSNTGETQYSTRRSASLSPTRSQTYRSHRSSSRRSRRDGSKHRDSGTDYYPRRKSCSDSDRSRERSTERRDRFRRDDTKKSTTSRATNEESSRRHEDRRDRGRSKERESRNRDRDSSSHRSSKGDRQYRDYRGRSSDRSSDRFHERWRRERSPGSSIAPPHYIEQVPVPIYYGPRPMMVGPMMPMGRGRPAPVMGPVVPFRQRFVPPNMMYRLAPPPNPRFGPYNSY